jgi:VWFA-related protein
VILPGDRHVAGGACAQLAETSSMSRYLPLVLTLVVITALVGGPALHAGPQMTTAAAGNSLVPVDVHVLDHNGKPVTDLTQADFTILEDGVPQQIRYLSPVSLTPGTAAPDAKPVLRTGISVSPQDHRIFIFALGLGRLEEPSRSISGLLRFVKTRLLPQDQVGIFAYDRALVFTTDHQKVADMLERFRKGHDGVDFNLSAELGPTGMAPLYGNRAIPKKLQTKIDDLILGPGAPPAAPVSSELIQPQEFGKLSLDDFMVSCATTLQDQNNLMALMEYLRHFEGQKHVVFVTEKGLLWPSDENDRALAALANDGRVSIHTMQAGGLLQPETAKEINATWQQAMSFRSLRAMSDLTGGLPAITEKGQAALDRLDEATRTGYLLGYQPSNSSWDGGYRNIVVKVNRPDITVLHRHGYYRQPGDGAFDRRGFITNDRLSAGGNFRREVNDIKVKVSVSQRNGSLVAEGKIDLSKVKVTTTGGSRAGLLSVTIYCLDSADNPMGTHTQTLPLKFSEEEYAHFLKDGFPYTIQFPIIRGTQHIRFIVYDFGSDLVGRSDTRVF